MSLEQLLGVEEKFVERAVEEIRQFAAHYSPTHQLPQQRKRRFGVFAPAQPKQITHGDPIYWAKTIYDWMQENFVTEVVLAHDTNLVFESKGVDYLTHMVNDLPKHKGVDVSQRYKAGELNQAAVYAMLATKFGLEAKVVFDDIDFPAFRWVDGMDEPVMPGTGRLYSVAVAVADKEGGKKEIRVLPQYSNGFGIDLTEEVALDNNPLLTVISKRSFEPSEKAVAALINAEHARHRNHKEASKRYEEAIAELGPDVKTLYDHAEAIRSAGMHSATLSEKAVQLFHEVLEADPHHHSAKDSLKYTKEAAAKASAKIEHQKRIVATNPADVKAALFLYYLQRHEGTDDGFVLAEQLLRSVKVESVSEWTQLAKDYYKLRGDATKAVEVLQGAAKQFPNDWIAHYDLGNLLFAMGRWEEAAKQLEHSIAGHFEHTKNNYFGAANAAQGKIAEAARFFGLGVQENEYNAEIRRNLAVAKFWQGSPESLEEAKRDFLDNILRQTGGSDVLSMLYLGVIYQKQGMKKPAMQHYMQALETNPDFEAARLLLKSVSNGLTLEEALEPLRPKKTGFMPNMQPEEKRYRSLDFRPLMNYDATGKLEEALTELDRLAEEATKPSKVQVNNAFQIPRYRQIVELRKRALAVVGAGSFIGMFPKLTDYKERFDGGDDDVEEVMVKGNLGTVTLSNHPTETSMSGFYTKITPDRFSESYKDNQLLIAAIATPETETEVTEKIAKGQEPKRGKNTLTIENLHGSLHLKPNIFLSLETLVGDVTGEVGFVDGQINVEYGNVNLVLRESIELVVSAGTATVENMARTNGNVYAPLKGKTSPPTKSDFRLTINAPHGNVKVAYQPFKTI